MRGRIVEVHGTLEQGKGHAERSLHGKSNSKRECEHDRQLARRNELQCKGLQAED